MYTKVEIVTPMNDNQRAIIYEYTNTLTHIYLTALFLFISWFAQAETI